MSMRRLVYLCGLVFFSLMSQVAEANHIVGGEFEFIHLGDNRYELRLIQYRDGAQTANTIIDPSILATVFRTSDNRTMMGPMEVPFREMDTIPYTNLECAIGDLVTVRVIYSMEVTLDPMEYADPEGYYIAYERCCRNNGVLNIANPSAAGQTYVLEFPPLVKDGERFINSSPVLFPPLSDYACGRELFYVNFEGTDPDGDSLVYSLATPINGSASQQAPGPAATPAPYDLVTWAPGFSLENTVPGPEPLSITKEGVLRVVAGNTGLYVFSVLCEEYRDGERIGSVVRDFQMLVVDCPPLGESPAAFIRLEGSSELVEASASLTFDFSEDKCFEILITDPDPNEFVSIRARAVNFRADLSPYLSNTAMFQPGAGDTLRTEVCLPDCSLAPDAGPMIIDFIAMDDACAVPLTDTLRLTVNITPLPNEAPAFTNSTDNTLIDVREGDQVRFVATATDADLQDLEYQVIPLGFSLEEYGIEINELVNEPGEVSLELVWDTDCQVYDFITRQEFPFRFLVNDTDSCGLKTYDEISLQVNVELPPNNDPVVSTSTNVERIEVTLGETIDFTALITDADGDEVVLDASPVGFSFADYSIDWTPASGTGSASSPFSWFVDCRDFFVGVQDTFTVYFYGNDLDKCKEPNSDTLVAEIVVSDPGNPAPYFEAESDTIFRTLLVNDLLLEAVAARDDDRDPLVLDLLTVPVGVNPDFYSFSEVRGVGRVVANLEFRPNCNLLNEDFAPRTMHFRFRVRDEDCLDSKSDTLVLALSIEDAPQNMEEFIPANVFTPNGDALNQTYFLRNLPIDNCASQFRQIRIYDRWGKEVYFSENRDFEWRGENSSSGVYYYFIDYTDFTFKGTVSLLR